MSEDDELRLNHQTNHIEKVHHVSNHNDTRQKITWAIYKSELDSICQKTRNIKNTLLQKAKQTNIFAILINYPVKIILGSSVSGGIIQLIDESQNNTCNNNINWITVLRTVCEIVAMILILTDDFFKFDTLVEKYYSASAAVDTFYRSVKYTSYHMKGTEGDRLEILLSFQNLYDDIITSNKIIQTVEDTSPKTPLDERGMQSVTTTNATNDDDSDDKINVSRSHANANEGNRMFYIHSMIDRIDK